MPGVRCSTEAARLRHTWQGTPSRLACLLRICESLDMTRMNATSCALALTFAAFLAPVSTASQDKSPGAERVSEAFRALAQGRRDEAFRLLKENLEEAEKSGRRDSGFGNSLNNFGEFYRRTGDPVAAEQFYRRALAVAREIGHQALEGAVLNNLGLTSTARREYDEAVSLLRQALALREKALGPEHPDVAITLDNLGLAYAYKKDYAKAEEFIKRSLAMLEKKSGLWDYDVTLATNNLAGVYKAQGKHAEAVALYQRQLDLFEKEFGADSLRLTGPIARLIGLFGEQHEHRKVEALLRRNLNILEKNSSPDYPNKVTVLTYLGANLTAQNKDAEAERHFRRALDLIDKESAGKPPGVAALALAKYAELLRKTGRDKDAAQLEERARKLSAR